MSGIKYHHLLSRLVNAPLLTTEARALTLLGVLAPRAGWAPDTRIETGGETPLLSDLVSTVPRLDGPRDDCKVYRVVEGVAVIPVEGDLVNRLGALDPWCGMTGYDGLVYKIDEAAADPEVRGVAFDINSCGGEALGCETVGDAIRRLGKPTRAIVWEAYSAACWIATQCDRVTVTRMGGTGSVGVISLHTDRSKQLADQGLTVTVLRAGQYKAEGDPFTPLTDEAKDRALVELQGLRTIFAEAVAAGRGMAIADVLATEAQTYGAADAVALGLADSVRNPDDALAEFIEELASGQTSNRTVQAVLPVKGPTMTTHLDDETEDEEATAQTSDAPPEENETGENDGEDGEDEDPEEDDEAKAKARVKAILTSPAGQANAGLAQHLALETTLSVKAALNALKAAGGDAKAARGGAFQRAMADRRGPELGAGGDPSPGNRSLLSAAVDRQIAALRGQKGGSR